jgi:hypothetical protein
MTDGLERRIARKEMISTSDMAVCSAHFPYLELAPKTCSLPALSNHHTRNSLRHHRRPLWTTHCVTTTTSELTWDPDNRFSSGELLKLQCGSCSSEEPRPQVLQRTPNPRLSRQPDNDPIMTKDDGTGVKRRKDHATTCIAPSKRRNRSLPMPRSRSLC